MLKRIMENIRAKRFEKNIGKELIEHITQQVHDELLAKMIKADLSVANFDDFEIWSDVWNNFLENTGLELMYDVEPIYDKDNKVVDIKVEISEV